MTVYFPCGIKQVSAYPKDTFSDHSGVFVYMHVHACMRVHTRASVCHGTCVENTGQPGLLVLAFHLDGDRVSTLLFSTAQARRASLELLEMLLSPPPILQEQLDCGCRLPCLMGSGICMLCGTHASTV